MLRITHWRSQGVGGNGAGSRAKAKANTEDLPDVIRSNARNVSGTIAQSVSGKREKRMQFRSRWLSCAPQLARLRPHPRAGVAEVLRPVSYFQKGVKGNVLSQIHVSFSVLVFFLLFFLSLLPSSLFPSTYRPPIFRLSSALGCSAVSLYGVC